MTEIEWNDVKHCLIIMPFCRRYFFVSFEDKKEKPWSYGTDTILSRDTKMD